MGTGAGVSNAKVKNHLIMSKHRLSYKANQTIQNIALKKTQIAQAIKSSQLEISFIYTEELLRLENDQIIHTYMGSYIENILLNIVLLSQSSIVSKIQADISSLIYSTQFVQIEELENFKDFIKKKYGKGAVERATHDWDGKVSNDLIFHTKKWTVTKNELEGRLMEISREMNLDLFL